MQPALVQGSTPGEIQVTPGDCRITADPSRLTTRNLDSCVAIAVHVPKLSVAALLRFRYPTPDFEPSESNPWLFAETAIPLLFDYIQAMGCSKQEAAVYGIGGASEDDTRLGRQNVLAMRRLLWREGVLLRGEDTGGTSPRSLWLEAGSGRLIVRSKPRMKRPLLLPKHRLPGEELTGKLCHSAS